MYDANMAKIQTVTTWEFSLNYALPFKILLLLSIGPVKQNF